MTYPKMIPPSTATLYEGELATFWFDENGILCAISKNIPRTLQMQKDNYAFINKITANKKVCVLTDTTNSLPQDKAIRDYLSTEIPKAFKAMAIISKSPLGQIVANIFVSVQQNIIPIKFFQHEHEAKEWLKNYL